MELTASAVAGGVHARIMVGLPSGSDTGRSTVVPGECSKEANSMRVKLQPCNGIETDFSDACGLSSKIDRDARQ